MATLTKQAIMSSFLKMLSSRPLKQITVSDIVEDCGINRKTFYYYFSDIYAVAEEYYIDALHEVSEQYPSTGLQWIEGLKAILKLFQDNRKITLNIYRSLDYELLENILFNTVIEYSQVYIEKKSEGRNIPDEDKKVVSEFITSAIAGSILRWIKNGLNGDPSILIDRYVDLCGGSLNYIATHLSADNTRVFRKEADI